MSIYIRVMSGDEPYQVWKITNDEASRLILGVSNQQQTPDSYVRAEPGESIWDALKRKMPWFSECGNPFHKACLEPGRYYPRIARPLAYSHPTRGPGPWCPGWRDERDNIAVARSQLTILARKLEQICQIVHPTETTLEKTFGHEIRNLLILACTEVEAHWKGILRANGAVDGQRKLDTRDYVLLMQAMRLAEYRVTFPAYPWLDAFEPYKGWRAECATQSLPWYASYNAVKHNREVEFGKATLRHAFEALSACFIMMVGQFGNGNLSSELLSHMHVLTAPHWSPSELYVHRSDDSDLWSPINFDFSREKGAAFAKP